MAEDFYQLGYGSNPITPRAIETTATDFSGVENLTDMYQKNLAAKKAKAGEVQESVFTATEGAYVNPELEAVRSSKANKIKSIYDSWDGSEEGLMQIKSELSGLESFKSYADLAEKKYIEGLYEDPTTIRKSPTMQAQIKGDIPEELTAFMSELDWNNPDDREKIKSMVGRSIMTNAKLRPEDALASMARDMKYGKTTVTTIENGKEVKREIPTTTEEQRKALGAKFDAAIATLEPEEAAQYDREEFISNYLPKQKTEKKPYEEKDKEKKGRGLYDLISSIESNTVKVIDNEQEKTLDTIQLPDKLKFDYNLKLDGGETKGEITSVYQDPKTGGKMASISYAVKSGKEDDLKYINKTKEVPFNDVKGVFMNNLTASEYEALSNKINSLSKSEEVYDITGIMEAIKSGGGIVYDDINELKTKYLEPLGIDYEELSGLKEIKIDDKEYDVSDKNDRLALVEVIKEKVKSKTKPSSETKTENKPKKGRPY